MVIRNNRKREFKFTNLFLLGLILLIFFYLFVLNSLDNAEAKADEAIKSYERYKIESLESDKLELQDKLLKMESVTVSPQNKALGIFYIQKYFPKQSWKEAEKVMFCESRFDPNIISKLNTNGSRDYGLWQLNDRSHKERFEKMYGISFEVGSLDRDLSTQYAKFLFDHNRWNSWVCRFVL